jgi:hypothetical protein
MQKVGFWTKVGGQPGFWEGAWDEVSKFQSFKVSRFQRFMGVQGVKLKIEVEFLQSRALFERFETLKL